MTQVRGSDNLSSLTVGVREVMAARMAFFIPGFAMSTWAPMIPVVKSRLGIEADVLGMLILCLGLSAFVTMPLAGMIGTRLGCRKTIAIGCVGMAISMVLLSCMNSIWQYAAVLAFFGASMGLTDVTMNTNAVMIEKLDGRRLMSGMHAFWSIGCFIGAGCFALMASLGLAVWMIAVIHSLVTMGIVLYVGRWWLDYRSAGGGHSLVVPRGIVIILGILAGMIFLAEGAIMDWSGVLLTEVKALDVSLAGAGYAIFSVAMLVMRLLGDRTVQRLGERIAVIGGSILTAVGFAILVWADSIYLNGVGFVLVGIGCSNIVPVFYSLLKYQNDMPIGGAVTAITSIGYTGVILGPAFLGFVAHAIDITAVFELLIVLLLAEAFIAGCVFKKFKV